MAALKPTVETTDQFLARGGQITKLEPREVEDPDALRCYSSSSPTPALGYGIDGEWHNKKRLHGCGHTL